MAKYVTDSEFKRLVRVCLDYSMSSDALTALEDTETLSLDDIIDSKAEDAALTVVRAAPLDKLGDVAQSLEGALSISRKEPYKGIIQLPVDFERLVRFKMSSWQYAVFTALPPLPPLYVEANSEFGICGTKDRPLVFLVPSTENGKDLCLEIFSAKNTDDILDGCLYVARPAKKRIVSDEGGSGDYYYDGSIGNWDDEGGSGDYYYDGSIGNWDDEGGSGDYYYDGSIGNWDDEDPEYVDLGLPSGTIWATKNVGAERPEDYGEYFAWGETDSKKIEDGEEAPYYSWNTYQHCNGFSQKLTKYCTQSSYGNNGFTDGLTSLLPVDDAARAKLGGVWETPSSRQVEELLDESNTSVMWSTLNGVNGLLVISKHNGKSIFLPAAGHRNYNNIIQDGTNCSYWTRSLSYESDPSRAASLFSRESNYAYYLAHLDKEARSDGLSIRPVFVSGAPLDRRKKPRINKSDIVEQPVEEVSGTVANGDTWKMMLGDQLLSPTVYYAAYLTALAVKDDNTAEKMLSVAKSLIEN